MHVAYILEAREHALSALFEREAGALSNSCDYAMSQAGAHHCHYHYEPGVVLSRHHDRPSGRRNRGGEADDAAFENNFVAGKEQLQGESLGGERAATWRALLQGRLLASLGGLEPQPAPLRLPADAAGFAEPEPLFHTRGVERGFRHPRGAAFAEVLDDVRAVGVRPGSRRSRHSHCSG